MQTKPANPRDTPVRFATFLCPEREPKALLWMLQNLNVRPHLAFLDSLGENV